MRVVNFGYFFLKGIGYDFSQHENVANWLQRCKDQMDGYEEINQSGVDIFSEFYKAKLSELDK